MKPRSVSNSAAKEPPRPELQELIRRRAYDFCEQCGRVDGHDVDDWLQAEAELTAKFKTAAAWHQMAFTAKKTRFARPLLFFTSQGMGNLNLLLAVHNGPAPP